MSRYASKPEGCAGCPLEHTGLSYVPGRGPQDAKIALIGQGPGYEEATAHEPQPFIGPSGRTLQGWMAEAGIARSEVYLDNGVRCWLIKRDKEGRPVSKRGGGYYDREPSQAEIKQCWKRHVGPVIHGMRDRAIEGGYIDKFQVVSVGVIVGRFLFGRKIGMNVAGTFERRELPAW